MKLESPCYKCPGHKFGCRTDCEAWAEFEAAKAELYAEKVKTYKQHEVLAAYKQQKITERKYKEHRERRR